MAWEQGSTTLFGTPNSFCNTNDQDNLQLCQVIDGSAYMVGIMKVEWQKGEITVVDSKDFDYRIDVIDKIYDYGLLFSAYFIESSKQWKLVFVNKNYEIITKQVQHEVIFSNSDYPSIKEQVDYIKLLDYLTNKENLLNKERVLLRLKFSNIDARDELIEKLVGLGVLACVELSVRNELYISLYANIAEKLELAMNVLRKQYNVPAEFSDSLSKILDNEQVYRRRIDHNVIQFLQQEKPEKKQEEFVELCKDLHGKAHTRGFFDLFNLGEKCMEKGLVELASLAFEYLAESETLKSISPRIFSWEGQAMQFMLYVLALERLGNYKYCLSTDFLNADSLDDREKGRKYLRESMLHLLLTNNVELTKRIMIQIITGEDLVCEQKEDEAISAAIYRKVELKNEIAKIKSVIEEYKGNGGCQVDNLHVTVKKIKQVEDIKGRTQEELIINFCQTYTSNKNAVALFELAIKEKEGIKAEISTLKKQIKAHKGEVIEEQVVTNDTLSNDDQNKQQYTAKSCFPKLLLDKEHWAELNAQSDSIKWMCMLLDKAEDYVEELQEERSSLEEELEKLKKEKLTSSDDVKRSKIEKFSYMLELALLLDNHNASEQDIEDMDAIDFVFETADRRYELEDQLRELKQQLADLQEQDKSQPLRKKPCLRY